jgi:hypothetical protein
VELKAIRELPQRQSTKPIKVEVADIKPQCKKKKNSKEELYSFCQNTKRVSEESYFEK